MRLAGDSTTTLMGRVTAGAARVQEATPTMDAHYLEILDWAFGCDPTTTAVVIQGEKDKALELMPGRSPWRDSVARVALHSPRPPPPRGDTDCF